MPKMIQTPQQTQRQSTRRVLSTEQFQLQQLIISHNHEIDQITNQELSQNPALETEDEPFLSDDEEPEESDDKNWNQDFDKPYDEYETGERLKVKDHFEWGEYDIASNLDQTVLENSDDASQDIERVIKNINLYRISGSLSEEAAKQLHEDLRILQKSMSYTSMPPASPTFEVIEEAGKVEVHIVPTFADTLIYREGFGKFSDKAKKFIKRVNDRAISLYNLATNILEDVQGDFFRQTDFKTAQRYLIPLSGDNISELNIDFPFKPGTKLLSKLSDLLVSSKLGILPFGFFFQSEAALRRLWVVQANKEGISTINDQCEWIKQQIQKRIDTWDSDDKRFDLIEPLLDFNTSDIKNDRKQLSNNNREKLI